MSKDKQLNDEQDLHRVYQDVSDEQPSLSVDKTILEAAHRALESEKPALGVDVQPVNKAWYVPASYVAILVISLSVVMKLALEPELEPELESMQLLDKRGYQPDRSIDHAASSELSQSSEPDRAAATLRLKEQHREMQKAEPLMRTLEVQSAPPAPVRLPEVEESLAIPSVELTTPETTASPIVTDSQPLIPDQKSWIEKLEILYQQQSFEELAQSLRAYRKLYPMKMYPGDLSSELMAWEQANLPVRSQNP